MPYRRRSGFKKYLTSFTTGIGIAALLVLAVVAISLLVRSSFTKEKVVSQAAPITLAKLEIQEPADASSEISGKYFGLCKKNSINSVEDFRKTVRNDTVLSAHFSGFNWETAKLGKQDKEVWTFVSYRIGEIIRRTSKPVRLPKGDGYVTDGVRIVRTYCCNDYVIAPPPMDVSLVSPADPVERVDGPPRRMHKNTEIVDDPPRKLSSWSPTEDSAGAIPEYLEQLPSNFGPPVFYSGSPHFSPDSPLQPRISSGRNEPTPVPEPNTFFLLGSGVAAFSLFCLLRRK